MMSAAAILLGGCALHTGGAEHYVGPVMYRFRQPTGTSGALMQIVRAGIMLDAGASWGVSAGVTDRFAAVPAAEASAGAAERWTTPFNPFGAPVAGRWNFSPFYLRVEGMTSPMFVRRETYGIELAAGPAARAASIGWTSRTLFLPREDALALLRFDSRRPLATELVTWPAGEAPDSAVFATTEESTP